MAQQIDVALVDVPPVKHEDFLQFLTKYGETYFDSERLDAFHDMHAFHDIISHDPRRVQPSTYMPAELEKIAWLNLK